MVKKFFTSSFIKSANNKSQFLTDRKVITFMGRSNVGKSTLINRLTGNKNLMITSKTPGATRMINYALIDNKFYIADVPGYGYAKNERTFNDMMKAFLEESKNLVKIYVLIDARRLLMEGDDEFTSYLQSLNKNIAFIFTKCDKLNTSERHYLSLQEEKLKDFEIFEVGLKDERGIYKIRENIYKSIL